MYSMIGLVYGVYLAFTIIAVWEQFSAAEEVTTAEATHLSELWRDAGCCISFISMVTGLVTFSILLVAAMQYPFSGDVSIRTSEPYPAVVLAV